MSELAELIARLGNASEGSRELDRAIDLAMNPDAALWSPGWYSGGRNEYLRWPDPAPGEAKYRQIYRYTTSLDAALSLVPEGWSWHVGVFERDHLDKPLVYAEVANDRDGIQSAAKGACRVEGGAATAPLALCTAALSARARGEQPPSSRGEDTR